MKKVKKLKKNKNLSISEIPEIKEILPILLKDQTTKENIIWATDNYKHNKKCLFNDQITIENYHHIFPRNKKKTFLQIKRSKEKGEVFTPVWVCNEQNDLIDNAWFGKKNIFNIKDKKSKTIKNKIIFLKDKKWQDYITDIRLEIACGEAPYLTSRYDTINGNEINVKNRIGLLDRKLRIINENINVYKDWFKWVEKALKSIYGFEWQGDNIFLARCNILLTVMEYYNEKFKDKNINIEILKQFAEIISWNIFQMDGIKLVIPDSCKYKKENFKQIYLFNIYKDNKYKKCPACKNENYNENYNYDHLDHIGTHSEIMDWNENKKIKFSDIIKKSKVF